MIVRSSSGYQLNSLVTNNHSAKPALYNRPIGVQESHTFSRQTHTDCNLLERVSFAGLLYSLHDTSIDSKAHCDCKDG